jgi:hypothetical protein
VILKLVRTRDESSTGWGNLLILRCHLLLTAQNNPAQYHLQQDLIFHQKLFLSERLVVVFKAFKGRFRLGFKCFSS